MKSAETKTWKQKLSHEFTEYMINVAYLVIFFCAFAISRRLTLAHYNIYTEDYFIGLVKALVIAKVIMIGGFLRISRKFENKPLIIPVLFKSVLFVVWVVLFDILEELIRAGIDTKSLSGAWHYLLQEHFSKMWLGGLIMVALAFIPFFALKELSRVVGTEYFRRLFVKGQGN